MSSNVRVSMLVEVTTGAWGDDCSLGQARKQATEDANGRLRRLFEKEPSIKVVGPIQTQVILVTEKKP